jgi:hypothetical protein
MTPQQVFDTVARHLVAQGHRAGVSGEDGTFQCQYFTPDGHRCAVGCLIPESRYRENLEGQTVTAVAVQSVLPFAVDHHLTMLLDELQATHDRVDYWTADTMRRRLLEVASAYGLDTRVVNKLDFENIKPTHK